MQDWYFYDLQYWGLDYPPLTAFHSWLCGKMSAPRASAGRARGVRQGSRAGRCAHSLALFDPAMMAFETSRGYESGHSKTLMRWAVVASDLLVFVPAVLLFCVWAGRAPVTHRKVPARPSAGADRRRAGAQCVALILLCHPAVILIDHGHYQCGQRARTSSRPPPLPSRPCVCSCLVAPHARRPPQVQRRELGARAGGVCRGVHGHGPAPAAHLQRPLLHVAVLQANGPLLRHGVLLLFSWRGAAQTTHGRGAASGACALLGARS